jgi:BirA family biotin operon repressor/biotin-[acetyl-CoA-carboxylase] ligase
MNLKSLQIALQNIPLGGLRYLEQVGSTNDIALKWVDEAGRDFSLVIANEQIAGRGRNGRSWQTPPDSALALSLLLLPNINEQKNISLFTGLGALAIHTALEEIYDLNAEIKWPNDILVDGKKLAGILVETSWVSDTVQSIVLGMGVNIRPSAVPPKAELNFPATSLEDVLGKSVDREDILHGILKALLKWRPLLGRGEMVNAWEKNLAFYGKQVEVTQGNGKVIHGKVLGINSDGSLRLDTLKSLLFGDVHLRPMRVSYSRKYE